MNFQELNPQDFKAKLEQTNNAILIDVREAYEFEDNNIGGTNIPMGEILSRTAEFDHAETILLCCKSGKRSKTAAYHLSSRLTSKAFISLAGGIEAYQTVNG